MDKEPPHLKTQINKTNKKQRTIKAKDSKPKDIQTRQNKWAKDQDQRPGARNKGCKYTSTILIIHPPTRKLK
jgi:hypothetical protein